MSSFYYKDEIDIRHEAAFGRTKRHELKDDGSVAEEDEEEEAAEKEEKRNEEKRKKEKRRKGRRGRIKR